MTTPETANDTVTLTLPRKTFEALVQSFATHIARSSQVAAETRVQLTRELESGQPLSRKLVSTLVRRALDEDKCEMATLLAKAFRPSGQLTAKEKRRIKCCEFERRGRATRHAYNTRF
jgi:hypothetical protein